MYLYRVFNYIDDMEKLVFAENSCVVVCIFFYMKLYFNIFYGDYYEKLLYKVSICFIRL